MIHLSPHDMAHGGEAVAKLDGKTFFIADAMPGETISAEILRDKGSWARAQLVEILTEAPARVDPRCRHFATCGGCQWQFAARDEQLVWKRSVVESQLTHLGGLGEPFVRQTVAPGAAYGYRNRMDFHVHQGRPALHRRRSKELVPLDVCHLLTGPLTELFENLGDLTDVRQLTMRASTITGDTLVILRGAIPPQADTWGASVARVRRGKPVAEIGRAHMFEEVAGHRLRITANAFFQNNTPGAEALVALVLEALEPHHGDTLLDGYAGGGLFSVAVGALAGEVTAVEVSSLGLSDLDYNLSQSGNVAATIVPVPFEESLEELDDWSIAVVDPPRAGLGSEGVAVVTAAHPRAIAYVSCDPASLARDARLLGDLGYDLAWAAPVDLFPQTFHVETVARFVPSDLTD